MSIKRKILILHSPSESEYARQLSSQLQYYIKIDPVIELRSGDAGMERQAQILWADIVVLLWSPAALDAFYDLALQAHHGGQRLFPVLIRRAQWEQTKFGGLAILPRNGVPVCEAPPQSQDSVWYAIAEELRQAWEGLPSSPQQRPAPADEKLRIVFVYANPSDSTRLRLDEEAYQIRHRLASAPHKDRIDLHFEPAVRANELYRELLKRPHILHFSGHGDPSGAIKFVDPHQTGSSSPVSPETLRELCSALGQDLRCVVLNACWSAAHDEQARALADVAGCVIGMADSITDKAAIEFAATFYDVLAFGRSPRAAFDAARANMRLAGGMEPGELVRMYQRAPNLPAPAQDPAAQTRDPGVSGGDPRRSGFGQNDRGDHGKDATSALPAQDTVPERGG